MLLKESFPLLGSFGVEFLEAQAHGTLDLAFSCKLAPHPATLADFFDREAFGRVVVEHRVNQLLEFVWESDAQATVRFPECVWVVVCKMTIVVILLMCCVLERVLSCKHIE